jgi:hypothetical protein
MGLKRAIRPPFFRSDNTNDRAGRQTFRAAMQQILFAAAKK